MSFADSSSSAPAPLDTLQNAVETVADSDHIFDSVTRLAAAICEVPIALLHLRSTSSAGSGWGHGLAGRDHGPTNTAFYAHTSLAAGLVEIADVSQDERFAEDPMVVAEPHVRFYAGVPLINSEQKELGTLCVFDRAARTLSDFQKTTLLDLASHAVYLLEARSSITENVLLSGALHEAEANLSAVVDGVPAMIGYWDRNLRNRFGNRAYIEWFGFTPEQMRGRHIRDVIGDRLYVLNEPYIRGALRGEPQHFERMIVDASGAERYAQASYIPDVKRGLVQGFFVLVTDITARKKAEGALLEEKERMRVTLESITDAVITTDASGIVTYLNASAEAMTACSLYRAAGHNVVEVLSLIDDDTREPVPNPVLHALRSENGHSSVSCTLVRHDGSECYVEVTATVIRDGDKARSAIVVCRDVTEARRRMRAMAHRAQHDSLTGLLNRAALLDSIQLAIANAERNHALFALLFIDLDGFKGVNDSLGHDVGDELLRSVAQRLRRVVRTSDVVSRLGGDEFVILLSQIARMDDAGLVARKLLAAALEPHEVQGATLRTTLSVGVAVYPDNGISPETLMKNADTAMYAAKRGGRDCFEYYRPDMAARGTSARV